MVNTVCIYCIANIITFILPNMNVLSDVYKKKSSMSQFLNKEK